MTRTLRFVLTAVIIYIGGGLGSLFCGKRFSRQEIKSVDEDASYRRIMGGQRVSISEYPWMVALMLNGTQVCGGVLVAKDWVVTAAHCFDIDVHPSHWQVVAGEENPADSVNRSAISVLSINRHPLYKSNMNDNNVDPVRLCCWVSNTHPSKICEVTGWGRIVYKGPQSQTLRAVQVNMVPRELCNEEISYNGIIHERALCAGPHSGGIGPCQFDSGGPLTCEDDGLWYLIGIVSYGVGCGMPNKYAVYSNMFQLTGWVNETMRQQQDDYLTSIESLNEVKP